MPSGNSKYPVAIVIDAVDGVTKKIEAINARLASITAPVKKINESFEKFAKASGLDKLGESFSNVGEKASDFFKDAKEFGLKIFGLGAAGAFATYELEKGFAETTRSIRDNAEALDISTKRYQELVGAGKILGISTDVINSSFGRFSANIGEAAKGNVELQVAFQSLAGGVLDSHNRIKSFDALLPRVVDKLAGMSAHLRNALGKQLFGKQFRELVPLFKDGSAGIKKFSDEATRLGGIISDNDVEAGDAFAKVIERLSLAFSGIKNTIAAALLPVIEDLAEQFTKFIVDNREDIKKWAADFAEKLPGRLKELKDNFLSLMDSLKPIKDLVKGLIDHFGAFKVIAAAVGLILGGKLLVSTVSLGVALIQLGLSMKGLAIAFYAVELGPFLSSLSAAFSLVAAGTPIMEAFNLVLLFNPIGLIVAGIAAFAAGAYLVYRNWAPIKKFFSDLWSDILYGFNNAFTLIREGIEEVKSIFGFGTGPSASSASFLGLTPALNGNPLGASQTVSSATQTNISKQENTVKVVFDNLPKGARVLPEDGEYPVDVYTGINSTGSGG